MKKRYSEQQIVYALKQAELGETTGHIVPSGEVSNIAEHVRRLMAERDKYRGEIL